METHNISLERIRVDERTQQRPLDGTNIARLASLLEEGGEFRDPIEVFCDGDLYYLAHGHHRYHAYRQQEWAVVRARVYKGGVEEAIDHSCMPLNADHGQPETRADRERRVKRYIERHPGKTDNAIATHCGVANHTVKTYRADLESNWKISKCSVRESADGRKYPATFTHTGRKGKESRLSDQATAAKSERKNDKHIAKGKRPERESAARIRELAEAGNIADQIAEQLDVSAAYVRRLATKHDITLPDHTIGRRKGIDPDRVVSETVASLEGLALGVQQIEGRESELNGDSIEAWSESLADSLRRLRRLHNTLKGLIDGNGTSA